MAVAHRLQWRPRLELLSNVVYGIHDLCRQRFDFFAERDSCRKPEGLQFFGETGGVQHAPYAQPMACRDHFNKRVRQTKPLFVLVVAIGMHGAF